MIQEQTDFSISDRALEHLLQAARSEEVDISAVYLRVAVVPGGCSGLSYELGWDTSLQEDDLELEHESLRLIADRRSLAYLRGSELDFTDGLDGKGFHFNNPQAVRTCACGESFGL